MQADMFEMVGKWN